MSSVGAYTPKPGQRVTEDWSTEGIASLAYSVDKSAAESLLDAYADDLAIARVRPALVLQEAAASEITRYFLGSFVPPYLLQPRVLRFAPLPRALDIQVVHADDVANAIVHVLRHRATGGVNVASDPPLTRDVFRELFGGVGPAVPPAALRALADVTWRVHAQPTHPGWLDLALSVPLLETSKLQALGWVAQRPGPRVLADFVAALHRGAGRPGPLLYRRRLRPGASTTPRSAGADAHGTAPAATRMESAHDRQ
jgi:nucleoside-diphosphate-sugar epimerase